MKQLVVTFLLAFSLINTSAQEPRLEVVIDITSTDYKVYQSVLLTLGLMAENSPDTHLDVIVYGEALPMLIQGQTLVGDKVMEILSNENVTFTACEISMSLFGVEKKDLLVGVETVKNAVDEIAQKQMDGWAYIKSGN